MKLLIKTTLVIVLSLLCVLPAFYWIFRDVLLERYTDMEAHEVQRDLQGVLNALEKEQTELVELARKWAHWDATYAFVQERTSGYLEKNIDLQVLQSIRVNLALYLDSSGQWAAHAGYRLDSKGIAAAWEGEEVRAYLHDQGRALLEYTGTVKVERGLLMVENNVFLAASLPILHSNGSGPPAGVLVFLRRIESGRFAELGSRRHIKLEVLPPDAPVSQAVEMQLQQRRFATAAPDPKWVHGYVMLRDFKHHPVFLLKNIRYRMTYSEGRELVAYFLFALVGFGMLLLVVVLWLLKNTVLADVTNLAAEVQRVTHHGGQRVTVLGGGELAQLAVEINRMLDNLHREQEKSERLLLNILPLSVAERMKQGESMIVQHFDSVTVIFCDLVGFSALTQRMSPARLVLILNVIFSEFDFVIEEYRLEKIKTIGDAYMAVGGAPQALDGHCAAAARAALELRVKLAQLSDELGLPLEMRVGISTGPVVAGVIGKYKFTYDLWGDAVNTAARMESHGVPGKIHCSREVFLALHEQFAFEPRGEIEVKGKGRLQTYFLEKKLGPVE